VNSFIGSLGTVGLAVALTALLILGTKGGGQVKSLPWGACLVISMIAGSCYGAAGPPFSFVRDGVGYMVALSQSAMPGLTMPAIALTILFVILWWKLTLRGISILGIVFWFIASGAGGGWTVAAARIHAIAESLAA